MKHALIAAALLLTSALAQAGNQNAPSEPTGYQKTCWKKTATVGTTADKGLIHPESRSAPESKVNATARTQRAT